MVTFSAIAIALIVRKVWLASLIAPHIRESIFKSCPSETFQRHESDEGALLIFDLLKD